MERRGTFARPSNGSTGCYRAGAGHAKVTSCWLPEGAWQTFTFAAVEQDPVPVILHPLDSHAFRFAWLSTPLDNLHCWHPFVLPLPQSTHLSAKTLVGSAVSAASARIAVNSIFMLSPARSK